MSNAAERRGRRGALAAMACCALLAVLPLLRDLGAPYGRGMGGWQGSFFSIAARNYELEGATAHGGYPRMEIAGGRISQDDMKAAPDGAWVYANHPPTVPLLAWSSIRCFAADGWELATPPRGTEAPLRLPFLLLHGLGAACLWLFLRDAAGARCAWAGAILYALLPVERVLGMHPNYEHAVLVPLLLALRAALAHARSGAGRLPWACAGWLAAASCVTWSPLCFVPGLALLWSQAAAKRALRDLAFVAAAACLPLVVHLLLVTRLGLEGADAGARSAALLAPWREGGALVWARAVWSGAQQHLGFVAWAALPALPLLLVRRTEAGARAVAALFCGALLCLAAFARHVVEGQEIFQLMLAPAAAALAGFGLAASHARGATWRAASAVLLALLVADSWWRGERLREDVAAPGRYDGAGVPEERAPLPQLFGSALGAATEPGETTGTPARHLCELSTAWHAWRDLAPVEAQDARAWLLAAPRRAYALPALDAQGRASVEALLGAPQHVDDGCVVWRPRP